MNEEPRPNSPEDVGGPDGYRKGGPLRLFEDGIVPGYIDVIDRVDRQCTGPHCRVPIRWAFTKKEQRMPLELRTNREGKLEWLPHHAFCPDADRFRRGPR